MNNQEWWRRHCRRVWSVLICAIAAAMFILTFILAHHAHAWVELPQPFSETAMLILAAVVASSVLLPFLWDRITKVSLGAVELELAQAKAERNRPLRQVFRLSSLRELRERLYIN